MRIIPLFAVNSPFTALRALVGWCALAIGIYMLAALIGSMIPRNQDWRETPDGTTIWLHNNGIHTSIIIPCAPPSADLINADLSRCLFPEGNAAAPSAQVRFQLIGWGGRDFYLNTPRWRDLRPGTAVTALLGSGQELLHVENLAAIPTERVERLQISQSEYRDILVQLYAPIGDSEVHGDGETTPIAGYGPYDVFYPMPQREGYPRYSALYTCNNWVSDILANAGIRTARWSPFPGGVMRWH